MRIAVLGAGVIGVTSAWYLRRAGHEVSVYEREGGPALQSSYANAGMIAWSSATPWAAPGLLAKALAWQFDPLAPLRVKWSTDPKLWRFMLGMLANASACRYAANKSALLDLGRYSRDALRDLRLQTGLQYDAHQGGTLTLFRTASQTGKANHELAWLAGHGIQAKRLDADECIAVEPGLAKAKHRPLGGLQYPDDETGDCRNFTAALAQLSAEQGVVFNYGVAVRRLRAERQRVTAFETDQGMHVEADAFVMTAGSYTSALLEPLGLRLPVYPVKGYSLTAPITNPEAAPRSTLMDETRKVAITRLGNRLRVAGMAELSGFDLAVSRRGYSVIEQVARDWFPQAADFSRVEWWRGLRPTTPSGLPIIGPTPYANLFLNCGHGTLGWTLSCGSARLLADIVSGIRPEMEMKGLLLTGSR